MAETEDKPRVEHLAALARIFHSEKYSDLKIVCGPETYNVHKSIVCMQSEFFDLACRPDSFKEDEEGVVTIKASDLPGWDEDADDPEMVQQMIYYFYHLTYLPDEDTPSTANCNTRHFVNARGKRVYDENMYKPSPGAGHLVSHAKMYALAEKYGVPGLKALALSEFKASANHNWNTTDFAESIPIVYRSTVDSDKDLRNAVVDVVHKHIGELIKKPEIECSLAEIQGFAYRLYRMKLGV